ncbi:MAG: hypothetical protein NW226_22450 [Microscillaceae bacterium]|nr:hypothetical protein [Microscillaceae bacterium]
MEELFKIPFLIDHYLTEHADLSFWAFLEIHYSSPEGQHKDPNHKKLPLKHHHHEGLQYFDVLIYEPIVLVETSTNIPFSPVSIYSNQYQFNLAAKIHHPPISA